MARLLIVLFSVAMLNGVDVTAESKLGPLQGVWQTVEVTVTGPGARTIKIPEPRPNLMIVSARYYSRVEVHAEGPRPVSTNVATASADELRALWGPFVGEAGTYEVNGTAITMRPLAAKNPAAMVPGTSLTYSFKLEGDTIWVTEQRNYDGPVANPVTIKAVRIE